MVKYNPKLKEKARRRRVWMTAGERALGHGYEIEGVMEVILRVVASLEGNPPFTAFPKGRQSEHPFPTGGYHSALGTTVKPSVSDI